jgi:hypothetical protein
MTTRPIMLFRNRVQATIAITGFNRWVCGVGLRHDPTNTECIFWFADHGGAEWFDRVFPGRNLDQLLLPPPRTENQNG